MIYDVAVIGAGVVGIAIARKFALEGFRVIVIERGSDLLSGASKANSAILHTGFDAVPGTLEHRLVQDGYRAYRQLARDHGLAILETTAVLVAWTEDEAQQLPKILATAHENGVTDCVALDLAELYRREPHLAPGAQGALLVPGEAVIDPWSPFLAYALQLQATGGRFLFRSPLTEAEHRGDHWQLKAGRETVQASRVINATGTQGDHVDHLLKGHSDFTIKPRKGQFIVYDKAAANLLHAVLLPVPNERTKGVVITRTAFGNLLVGPTAEEQEERDRPETSREGLDFLRREAERLIPALSEMPVTATYAGIRPATEKKDYRIAVDAARGLITVGGIRSTGLTASLGIADHVFSLAKASADQVQNEAGRRVPWPQAPVSQPDFPRLLPLAEHLKRDWTVPGYGEIVCHCEMVTLRELRAALTSTLPPGDLSSVKRRCRAMMGRCQGFHCQPRVAALFDELVTRRQRTGAGQ